MHCVTYNKWGTGPCGERLNIKISRQEGPCRRAARQRKPRGTLQVPSFGWTCFHAISLLAAKPYFSPLCFEGLRTSSHCVRSQSGNELARALWSWSASFLSLQEGPCRRAARQRKPGGTLQVPALRRASTRFRGSLGARRKIALRPELVPAESAAADVRPC